MNWEIIEDVRRNNPLIHHITNQVVMNFSANGLLSFGAAPVMAHSSIEAADMASAADGLLINIGTVTRESHEAMILAGEAANDKGVPVVLDPVGIAATPYRTQIVNDILDKVKVTVIKGNAGEMAFLAETPWKVKGVDSVGEGNVDDIAHKVAVTYDTTAVITGKTDTIFSGDQLIHQTKGHPLLENVTGAGCLLGSMITACLTTEHKLEEQVDTAVSFYGLAAEYAASLPQVSGSGTFKASFIDALSFDSKQLERR